MRCSAWRYCISDISLTFVLGLFVAIPVTAMFFHEMGHLFACRLLGLEVISWSPIQVVHLYSSNQAINTAVAFAGGLAQALSSFVLFLIISLVATVPLLRTSQLDSRLRNWSTAIGLEAGFLTVGFTGIIMAFWEGYYNASYSYLAGNAFVGVTITSISGIFSFLILHQVFPGPADLEVVPEKIQAG